MNVDDLDSGTDDRARPVIFPPVVPIGCLLGAAGLQVAAPLTLLSGVPWFIRAPVAAMLATGGLALFVGAIMALRYARTPIRPTLPSTALVVTGPYGRSRHPIYVGGTLVLFAVFIVAGLDWGIVLLAASLPLTHYGVVLPEEAYMTRRFGAAYDRYRRDVPRYL
jgi:protein-S-isoprenylcysteine O-methyltransferase Ste14